MTLTLYNTLTRKKEPFRPIDPANVRMYVCGPTVYDFAHIGNARPVIVFDVLFRLLRHLAKHGVWDGGKGETRVTYARNITDVDDKINARAAEEYPSLPLNEAIAKVTEKTSKQFHEDMAALGVLTPADVNVPGQPPLFIEPRATEHIAEMRALCEALVAKGNAYVAQDHVLFDVSSMPDYGRLANRSLEEMEAGARVDVAPYKRGPMDFVLWKPSKPGEPAWPSPSGIATPGRPGWHIECSAMADRWLWQEPQMQGLLSAAGLKQPHVFDIHGGGIDLVFPHHENEIAQSRCGHGTPAMANVWMHNGYLQVEGEKMSKSLGNFVTIRELLGTDKFGSKRWPGQVIRFAMLMTHYRQPIDFGVHSLEQAWIALTSFKNFADVDTGASPSQEFLDALSDDLNTPRAIAELHRLHKSARDMTELANKLRQPGGMLERSDFDARRQLGAGLEYLGVDIGNYDREWAQKQRSSLRVNTLIAARNAARKAKDFKEADRIRDELSAMGIQLKDAKDPVTGEIVTTWEVKR